MPFADAACGGASIGRFHFVAISLSWRLGRSAPGSPDEGVSLNDLTQRRRNSVLMRNVVRVADHKNTSTGALHAVDATLVVPRLRRAGHRPVSGRQSVCLRQVRPCDAGPALCGKADADEAAGRAAPLLCDAAQSWIQPPARSRARPAVRPRRTTRRSWTGRRAPGPWWAARGAAAWSAARPGGRRAPAAA